MPRAPAHLSPEAPLADRVLLPGDPHRALRIAQAVLERPLMFNHARGLWGYTGTAPDGRPLSVQSTGMGGPSAAIVLEELADLGVRRAIRVGTCGALQDGLELGELIVAEHSLPEDGTSRALGAGELADADTELTAALREHAPGARAGTVACTDLFYEPDRTRERGWLHRGVLAVEMESATLFTIGARRGVAVACLLTVSDLLGADGRRRMDGEAMLAAGERMGAVAAAALAAR